ncbi:insulinase family protein [Pseudomonas putida]|uniref:Insulinase family protein n=2 Tax=Pseudomonas putida TaxID=303 RepID=A0A4D6XDM9_PSEPU|nr:insulinase family protein [Pseudomonas putida]
MPRLTSLHGLDLNHLESIDTHVQTWTTEAGTRVQFVEARGLPVVDLVLRFGAGIVQDTDKSGLAALTLYMLDEGSDGLTASEHAAGLERLGAEVSKDVRLEQAVLSLRSLSQRTLLDPALALFGAMAAKPDFLPGALEKVKSQTHAYAASRLRSPVVQARTEAFGYLFDGHPYGNPIGTTPEGIEAVTVDDLRAFHRKAYSASNMQMTLVGDLSTTEAKAIAHRISQALPQGWVATPPPAVVEAPGTTRHIERPGASTCVLLALPMNVPANDPQFPAMVLAREILTSGLDSRLMTELRQRRGLTYDVSSQISAMRSGGVFMIEWDIAPHLVEATKTLVGTLLQRFIDEGPTEAELELARHQLAGELLRDVAQNKRLAGLLSATARQRQPEGYLNGYNAMLTGLTTDAVRETLRRRLDLRQAVWVSVGPTVDQQPLPELPALDQ